MAGTLYVCSTPIGNLEDITLRALRVLREADAIVGEDTRRTRKLLSHYDIRTPLAPSLFQGEEDERTERVLDLLREGRNVALVSDAGTPLLSDPGYPLVRACVAEGIPVVPVPGPSALLAALVASGLPTDRFLFLGYLPRSAAARRRALEVVEGSESTVVFYESPRRVRQTLGDLAAVAGSRAVVLAREMTKLHEEFIRGTTDEVLAALASRSEIVGEIVVVVAPAPPLRREPPDVEAIRLRYHAHLSGGLSPSEALRQTVLELETTRRAVYRAVHLTDR